MLMYVNVILFIVMNVFFFYRETFVIYSSITEKKFISFLSNAIPIYSAFRR